MNRRNFLKGVMPLALAPLAFNGIPVRVMGQSALTSSFSCEEVSDRILVLIQLHGGNDGLNTLIPLEQYNTYKSLRPLIGIKDSGPRKYIELDSTMANQDQVGLHPDLMAMKSMYDDGLVHIVQDVSYPDNNGSHFKGTDILLSGKDGINMPENPVDGWFGRYLDHRYPNYPDVYPNPDMEDPPGLEFGSHIVSLGFHRQVGIPMGLTLSNNPTSFQSLLSGVGGALPDQFPASDYGAELQYLVEMERSTNVYAERLDQLFTAGTNDPSVTYPDVYHTPTQFNYKNRLAPQLKTVARLISGGSRTKIFLVRMGGFDTHAHQALAGKPSYGAHGSLLYHLSQSVKAFQDDLAAQGLADRVMTVTLSEFGRQVAENGTMGTDHGTSAPMMIFGRGVNPGVSGTNPNLNQINNNNFTSYQHDYRQVFTTVMQDWLGANNGTLDETGFYEFSGQKLNLVNSQYNDGSGNLVNYVADTTCDTTPDLPTLTTSISHPASTQVQVEIGPNPTSGMLNIQFEWSRMQPAHLALYDMQGRTVLERELRMFAGMVQTSWDIGSLHAGTYVLQIVANKGSAFSSRVICTEKIVVTE
ncbi:DUF1501 domain-containing protein [Pontibacter sp. G13]|uniref:DUF1501 domain-containing protein n=1 Tax=Pontibacter sp. G13 TaxID=3074898 RepID=UPI00288BAF1B|nr:DUF1501 domain-containing protein [Pontibacter sp. G13]WNJ20998.1 DUF1501 domain-containing protein [Pontibacter sp. G13]